MKGMSEGNNIRELRDAIEMVVKMLANKGIKVTQSGIQAFVSYNKTTLEPERVNIPMVSERSSPELVVAIKGFVDHEVGHLLFTDPHIVKRAAEERIGNLHNIFEDTFIEAQMKKAFAGSTRNIDKTVEFAIKHFFQKSFDEALKARQGNPEMSEAKFFIAGLAVPAIRAMAGHEAAKEFMADKWKHVESVYAELKLLEPKIQAIDSSLKALQMANTFRDILCEVDQRERDERAKGAEDEEGESDHSGDSNPSYSYVESDASGEPPSMGDDIFNSEGGEESQPSGSSSNTNSSKSKPSDEPEEDEPEKEGERASDDEDGAQNGGSEDTDQEDKSEGAESGSEESEGSGESEGEADEEDGEDGGSGGGDSESDSSGGEAPEKSTDFNGEDGGEQYGNDDTERNRDTSNWSGGSKVNSAGEREDLSLLNDIEEVSTFDSALENALTEGAVNSLQDRSYMAFSNEHDKIEPFTVPSHKEWEAKQRRNNLRRENGERIGVMAKALERIIAARNRSTYVPGFKSGRLHSSSLYKLKTGDNRVFRRKEEARTKDTAVLLLVDCSGSMANRNRIYKASEAAYALSTSLERINVKTQVMGFTTIENYAFFSEAADQIRELEEKVPGFQGGFDRVSPLLMPIFKGFDERMTPECEMRIAGLPFIDMANNADSESVEIAANILATRREERKILVVLSDGQPAQHRIYSYAETADRAKEHLHHVVGRVERAGIEILGIGIEADAVTEYYPKNIVLDDVSELPTKIVSEMTSMLLK